MSDTSLAMLPWFPRDFIASTLGWRLIERALYRCFLDAQWELGSLPSDEAELMRIAGATAEEFEQAWPRVKEKFRSTASGRIQNDRLEEHRKKALEIRDGKRRAGRAGGVASGRSRSRGEAEGKAERQANTKQDGHSATSFASSKPEAKPKPPSPSPSVEETHTTRARARAQVGVHESFERFRASYPAFAGRQHWVAVEGRYQALIEQGTATAEDLQQAVDRYAAFVAAGGVSSTAHVLRPDTFLTASDEPWRQEWVLPVAIPRAKAAQAKFVAPPDEPEVANA